MSQDLTLLPLYDRHELTGVSALARATLWMDQDSSVFGQLSSVYRDDGLFNWPQDDQPPLLVPQPLPPQLVVYMLGNDERGVMRDCYDRPLTFLYASELKKVRVPSNNYQVKAIFAYIRELPDLTPVVLVW